MADSSHSIDRQVAAIVRVLERQRRRAAEVSGVRRGRTVATAGAGGPGAAGTAGARPAPTDRAPR